MRRAIGLLLGSTLALSLAGLGPVGGASAADKPAASTGKPSVSWSRCDDGFLRSIGAKCGSLQVPLDYAHPDNGSVTLALSRLRHTAPDKDYQGIMLANPGGPGGSGLQYSFLGFLMPDDVRAAYDWIGFDPRGVGASTPALSCDPDVAVGPRPDYDIGLSDTEAVWRERSADYAQACDDAGGDLLGHLKTTDNVRDMDAIRAALEAPKLNFYGFSYGTYLAQVYATMFPARTGRMVLDANVDPRRVWYDANLDQDIAFERVIDLFFAWTATYDDTYHLGDTAAEVENAYYAERTALTAEPAGTLGPDELTDAMLLPGYVQALWPDLAQALSDLVTHDDAVAMTSWYEAFDGPGEDNGYAMYLATICTDAPWEDVDTLVADSTAIDVDHPFFTWGNAWFNAPCSFWPAAAAQPVDVGGTEPILLAGETLDAATPFAGSLEVRRRFPNSALIGTDGGTTHANTLAGNPCVDEPIFQYLRDGTLPTRDGDGVMGADVTCDPLPAPVPAASAAVTASAGTHRPAADVLWARHLAPGHARG